MFRLRTVATQTSASHTFPVVAAGGVQSPLPVPGPQVWSSGTATRFPPLPATMAVGGDHEAQTASEAESVTTASEAESVTTASEAEIVTLGACLHGYMNTRITHTDTPHALAHKGGSSAMLASCLVQNRPARRRPGTSLVLPWLFADLLSSFLYYKILTYDVGNLNYNIRKNLRALNL